MTIEKRRTILWYTQHNTTQRKKFVFIRHLQKNNKAFDWQLRKSRLINQWLWTGLMPMTHVPEIGAENRYQKNRYRFLARLTCNRLWYRIFPVPVFSVTNKTMLCFRAGLCYPFPGMGFRRRFLVRVTWALMVTDNVTRRPNIIEPKFSRLVSMTKRHPRWYHTLILVGLNANVESRSPQNFCLTIPLLRR